MSDLERASIILHLEGADRIGIFLREGGMVHRVVIAIKFLPAYEVVGIVDFIEVTTGDSKSCVGQCPEKRCYFFPLFQSPTSHPLHQPLSAWHT